MEDTKTTSPPGYTAAPSQFPTAPPPKYDGQPQPQYGTQPQYGGVQPQYGQPQYGGVQPGQPIMVQPPMGTSPVMLTASGRPQNHLLMSVLACLFCFWPTGIVAIIHSLEVDKRYFRGDHHGAMDSSMKAYKWAKISIIVGIVCSCIYGVLVLLNIVLRVSFAANSD